MESDTNTRDIRLKNDHPSIWFYLPFVLAAIVIGIVVVATRERTSLENQSVQFIGGEGNGLSSLGNQFIQREIVVYYPKSDSDWVSETFEIKGSESIRQEIRQCLELILNGSSRYAIALFSEDLDIDELFLDTSNNLVIDFQTVDQGIINLGGIQREMLAIQSIIRTLSVNFPTLQSVRFLFNHKEVKTFAGHIAADQVFSLQSSAPPVQPPQEGPSQENSDAEKSSE